MGPTRKYYPLLFRNLALWENRHGEVQFAVVWRAEPDDVARLRVVGVMPVDVGGAADLAGLGDDAAGLAGVAHLPFGAVGEAVAVALAFAAQHALGFEAGGLPGGAFAGFAVALQAVPVGAALPEFGAPWQRLQVFRSRLTASSRGRRRGRRWRLGSSGAGPRRTAEQGPRLRRAGWRVPRMPWC